MSRLLPDTIAQYTNIVANIEQFEQGLLQYAQLIEEARAVQNLIGKNENIMEHIIDSISPLSIFFNETNTIQKNISSKSHNKTIHIADLGSGGGFPAIPLALGYAANNYHSHWYLIERTLKKATFLQNTIDSLQAFLPNTTIEVIPKNLREWKNDTTIHIITSRAFRPFSEIHKELKKIGGHSTIMLYKGKMAQIEEEFAPLQNPSPIISLQEVFSLTHEANKERHLVKLLLN